MVVYSLQSPASRLATKLPSNLHPLSQLALNFWWSWVPEGVAIFRDIDAQTWEQCHHNPVQFLATLPEEKLRQLAAQPIYLQRLQSVAAEFERYMQSTHSVWAKQIAPQITPEQPVAYFSVEFGLHQALQIYAGGLGILAGDYLKSASDLGLPVVGVGLLYRQGYFQQLLNSAGWQEESYPEQHLEALPLELVLDANREPLTIEIAIGDRSVKVQVWRIQVGRANLYLLDAGVEDNHPDDRKITARLYQADKNVRIAQEIILGMGGVKLLQCLEIDPKIYHLNESNAAFTLLEIAHQLIQETGESFEKVKTTVQERCVFTTHTPVMAGHETFPVDLMEEYFSHYWQQLGLSREQFLDLGAVEHQNAPQQFNMTALALRLSKAANGVSQLNGEVSRQMWSQLYPDRQLEQVPIGTITNGVHAGTWTAPLMADLYAEYLGRDWAKRVTDIKMWAKVDEIPPEEIWQRHQQLKEDLIAHVRNWVEQARARRGEDPTVQESVCLLDAKVLTIGLARRFSSYKRGDLIFHAPQRALQILSNSAQPVQIIFAGKAHPTDEKSKHIIQHLIEWTQRPELKQRIVFLEDYDILTAKKLVQGVDLWLNTPQRPLEASGTSGQKVCFNGGINCSILDGWWREAYQVGADGKGINGWAIGEDCSLDDPEAQAQKDAESLYDLLAEEIIPLFYDVDTSKLPQRWIEMVRASMKTVVPIFNTDRMVTEYVTQMYLR